ncbi:MAG: glycosyltransferase family 2 protein [Bacteroidetes bacterium]|nr:MAG: glycosyltransferase family 2 protein [Bacteroidota bacterium]
MTNQPLVTVIMPTYNRVDKIGNAIKSVLKQTYQNTQVIVVDDGSTDGTESFIRTNYPDVDYALISHAGQAAARNKGLSLAEGKIIASLDSDDEWKPEFLETCVRKLEVDQLDFVFANWSQDFPDGRNGDFLSGDAILRPFITNRSEKWQMLSSSSLRKLYLKSCPSPSSSVVIQKSSIVSRWNEKIIISDDWCLLLDMVLTKNCSAAFTMDMHWIKHINTNNVFDGRRRSELLELLYIRDTQELMHRFKEKLTRSEYNILIKRRVRGLVELAKHYVIDGFVISQSLRLMKNSVMLSVPHTLAAIPDVIIFGLNRHVKKVLKKIRKKKSPQLLTD